MELKLERPLLFFDIESTGLNITTDGIIELSFVKVMPDGSSRVKTWKVKPWDYARHCQIPINPSASAVNGVHDEDLKDCPTFIKVVEEVAEWLEGSDLAGFNSTKFDLPMLAEEMERVRSYCESRIADPAVPQDKKERAGEILRKASIDLHGCRMIDVQTIYHYMEPRNLKAAYRFYCGGGDFDNAHTAEVAENLDDVVGPESDAEVVPLVRAGNLLVRGYLKSEVLGGYLYAAGSHFKLHVVGCLRGAYGDSPD